MIFRTMTLATSAAALLLPLAIGCGSGSDSNVAAAPSNERFAPRERAIGSENANPAVGNPADAAAKPGLNDPDQNFPKGGMTVPPDAPPPQNDGARGNSVSR